MSLRKRPKSTPRRKRVAAETISKRGAKRTQTKIAAHQVDNDVYLGSRSYPEQEGSEKRKAPCALEWMHNFAADNGRQYVGQRNTDNGRCELGTPDCEQRNDVTTFNSQGCSATVKWSVTLNYKDVGTHTYRFSLKELDPKSVVWVKDMPFENAVIADTANSVKKVNVVFTPPAGATWDKSLDEPQTFVALVFDNGDHAKRFVKAFKHAIQLCGGKPSPF